ncbi:hypothetical protein CPC08DRAFT_698271 [Agrocybe pediades]|nr:hypothetical protein CPC08DRAFT_698271 [Agrocybe pediades]
MFGEDESESPRVPSPWDSLMSTPPSPVPGEKRSYTPSPLAAELIPKLVPESDDGNVEYKLQLLNPSPARFARLVTQMKWRLLEGGGQAYYELGVADSGDLIGLPREELEQSLETLEMMAGEIGASVIVVKEVEVPAILATLAKRTGGGGRTDSSSYGTPVSVDGGYSTTTTTETETETEADSLSGTDVETEDLSMTVVLDKGKSSRQRSMDPSTVFSMDSEDAVEVADDGQLSVNSTVQTRFSIDLEIFSVFKPRPTRTRIHNHPHYAHSVGGKAKRVRKHKHLNMLNSSLPQHPNAEGTPEVSQGLVRRQNRDRRREEKRKALEARATHKAETEVEKHIQEGGTLVDALESLHVGVVDEPKPVTSDIPQAADDVENPQGVDDDDDVFASPTVTTPSFPKFAPSSTGESHLDVDATAIGIVTSALGAENGTISGEKEQPRLIVEALVVRKMSLGEAFLDFGGFSLT